VEITTIVVNHSDYANVDYNFMFSKEGLSGHRSQLFHKLVMLVFAYEFITDFWIFITKDVDHRFI